MNQDHKPDEKRNYSQNNTFILWNTRLINHFNGNNMLYSLRELEDTLTAQYSTVQHPAARPIVQLLKTSSDFLNQTNLEKSFNQSAIESKTDKDWQIVFANVVSAIRAAQEQCHEELKGSQGLTVLEAAIQYCKNCIALRIHAIERSSNKMNQIFIKHGEEIRKIMACPSPPTYKKS